MIFERGQIYTNEEDNVFIKGANNGMVRFIIGLSPSAIHNIEEIPAENLEAFINEYGYKRQSPEYEAFVNA